MVVRFSAPAAGPCSTRDFHVGSAAHLPTSDRSRSAYGLADAVSDFLPVSHTNPADSKPCSVGRTVHCADDSSYYCPDHRADDRAHTAAAHIPTSHITTTYFAVADVTSAHVPTPADSARSHTITRSQPDFP